MMRFSYVFVSLMLLGTALQAQDLIYGKITDAATRAPLAYVEMESADGMQVISDYTGTYYLSFFAKWKQDSVRLLCPGYFTKKVSMQEVKSGKLALENVNRSILYMQGLGTKDEYTFLQEAMLKLKTHALPTKSYIACDYYEENIAYSRPEVVLERNIISEFMLQTPEDVMDIKKRYYDKVFLLSLKKEYNTLARPLLIEPNYLKYGLQNLPYYDREVFSNKKKFDYSVSATYYDDELRADLMNYHVQLNDSSKGIWEADVLVKVNTQQVIRVVERLVHSNKTKKNQEHLSEISVVYFNLDEANSVKSIHTYNSWDSKQKKAANTFKDIVYSQIIFKAGIKNGAEIKADIPELIYKRGMFKQTNKDVISLENNPTIKYEN